MSEKTQIRVGLVFLFLLSFPLYLALPNFMPIEAAACLSTAMGMILGAFIVIKWTGTMGKS